MDWTEHKAPKWTHRSTCILKSDSLYLCVLYTETIPFPSSWDPSPETRNGHSNRSSFLPHHLSSGRTMERLVCKYRSGGGIYLYANHNVS